MTDSAIYTFSGDEEDLKRSYEENVGEGHRFVVEGGELNSDVPLVRD